MPPPNIKVKNNLFIDFALTLREKENTTSIVHFPTRLVGPLAREIRNCRKAFSEGARVILEFDIGIPVPFVH